MIGILNRIILIIFFIGLGFFIYQYYNKKESQPQSQNEVYILTNQIKKMNKLVVMEQNTSSLQKTKFSQEFLGTKVIGTEKTLITYTKTNAQVSYDLNKMKIDVDSINKKLIIREFPEPQIRIIPSVEIQSMDESIFSDFDEKDIKETTKKAKDNAYKSIDKQKLIQQGKQQLQKDLDHIFVLAKALHYTIEDQTNTFSNDILH